MEKLSPLLAEWGSMKFLISEILLCLLAASILGLIIGWLCKAAFARDKLKHRDEAWRRKLAEREEVLQSELKTTQQDAGELKGRMQSIEGENQTLNSSLEANKSAVHKAHIEVQQLSKRQRDTQERLQKIITEKDREISRLQQESAKGKNTPPRALGFTSRKPAKPQPAPPAAPQQPPAQTARPAAAAEPPRTAPAAQPNVGGRPDISGQGSNRDPGYRPGTQTGDEDFDKTQALRAGGETISIDGHDQTAANQTMGNASQQAGGQVKRPQGQAAGRKVGDSTAANVHADHTQQTTGHDANDSSLHNTANPARDVSDHGKKRSLWDRVKSTVTKKPE